MSDLLAFILKIFIRLPIHPELNNRFYKRSVYHKLYILLFFGIQISNFLITYTIQKINVYSVSC